MSADYSDEAVDPKVTEVFLLGQPDVIDASVWFVKGDLHAHVTVHEDSDWTKGGLYQICSESLGPEHAPSDITLSSTRRRIA